MHTISSIFRKKSIKKYFLFNGIIYFFIKVRTTKNKSEIVSKKIIHQLKAQQ